MQSQSKHNKNNKWYSTKSQLTSHRAPRPSLHQHTPSLQRWQYQTSYSIFWFQLPLQGCHREQQVSSTLLRLHQRRRRPLLLNETDFNMDNEYIWFLKIQNQKHQIWIVFLRTRLGTLHLKTDNTSKLSQCLYLQHSGHNGPVGEMTSEVRFI